MITRDPQIDYAMALAANRGGVSARQRNAQNPFAAPQPTPDLALLAWAWDLGYREAEYCAARAASAPEVRALREVRAAAELRAAGRIR